MCKIAHSELSIIYVIDNMALQHGHVVLRLPPYHCELNPIELIWSVVKRFIQVSNTTCKLRDMEALVPKAFAHITPELWQRCIRHVEKIEEQYTLNHLTNTIPPTNTHLHDHDYCQAYTYGVNDKIITPSYTNNRKPREP